MSSSTGDRGTFATFGIPLAKSGFEVIWIPKGRKGPIFDDWQEVVTNEKIVRRWAANGHADANVGVRTKFTPAIDIDILDATLSAQLCAWCLANIGPAPSRVGRSPKVLLVYATAEPTSKRNLLFELPDGSHQKIEVLGDGQQFVAYGLHPDTGKNYVWTSKLGLSDIETYELSTLTQDHIDALFDEATRLATALGWKVKQRTGRSIPNADIDELGLENFQAPGTFTDEELDDALGHLDPDAGYDFWLQVGQGLHHQYGGGEDGFDKWDKWSERSLEYDLDELRAKWESFSDIRAGKVVTAKSIIHWAKEAKERIAGDLYAAVLHDIEASESLITLTGPALIKSVAKRINATMVDTIVEKIKARAKALGTKLSTPVVRKLLKQAMRQDRAGALPPWCAHYVYVAQDDKFYDQSKHRRLSDRAFNAMHNRFIQPAGEEAVNATRFVLDTLELPVVDTYTYLPGHLPIVDIDGSTAVNTYDDSGVPAVPSLLSDEEMHALELVKAHFEMLFPDERERSLLLSYLAYTVQHPDKRITWAPLIYGGEGAGKTFIFEMMRAVLGNSNAMPVSAKQLQQQFTGWAEGNRLVVFEEIRLTGHSRFDVLESLKPLLTNRTVDVRRMQTDTYSVINVTNYLLFTNYEDALPLSNGDRRYLILATSLVTKDDIAAFNKANPKYFTRLFSAVDRCPGAILGWLQEMPMHPEFKPSGNAPETNSKTLMRESSHDDEYDDLEALLARAPRWDVCNELLSITSLKELVAGAMFENAESRVAIALPAAVRMKPILRQLGFSYLGRARSGSAGAQGYGDAPQHRYYSRNPNAIKKVGLQKFVSARLQDDEMSFN